MQILIVSSGMLVKSESNTKPRIKNFLSCSTIFFENEKESLTVDPLVNRQPSIGARKLAILQVAVTITDNIRLKGGKASTIGLRILQRPDKTTGLDLAALTFLCSLSLRLPGDFNLFHFSLIRFS